MKKLIVLLLLFISLSLSAYEVKLDKYYFQRDQTVFVVINALNKGFDVTNTRIKLTDAFIVLSVNIQNPAKIYLRIHVKKTARYGKHKCSLTSGSDNFSFEINVERKNLLLVDLDSYDEFFFRFKFGYEYSSMEKIFEEGFPRLGFFVNFTTRSKKNSALNLFVSGDFMLSSTPFISGVAGASNTNNIDKAFEFYGTAFLSLFSAKMKVSDDTLYAYFGPIFTGGAIMKNDFTGKSSYLLYGGFRMMVNPDVYTDILFGRNENMKGYRLFIRAQLPVFKLKRQSSIYLGFFGNFSVDGSGTDFVRIFLSADFDPIKLLTSIF